MKIEHGLKVKITVAALNIGLLLGLTAGLSGCGQAASGDAGAAGAALAVAAGELGTATGLVEEILPRVVEIRGIEAKNEVKAAVASREQLRQMLAEESAAAEDLDKIARVQKSLRRLGLIEVGTDLRREVLDLISTDTAGFYDQETGELKVISAGGGSAGEELTLAHELTHALQDQHFSLLKSMLDDSGDNDDRYLAQMSLIEGDATLVEEAYLFRYLDERRRQEVEREAEALPLPAASPYLLASFAFPYEAGADFTAYLLEYGGWLAVDAAYQRPPNSTEQILHPEKYLEGEAPVKVELPALPPVADGGWQQVDENVLGEFDLLELLSGANAQAAEVAAAGWGGSRYRLYTDAVGREALLLLTAWDSDADASEFRAAFTAYLKKKQERPATGGASGSIAVSDGVWSVVQQEAYVAVAFAPDTDLATALTTGMLLRQLGLAV